MTQDRPGVPTSQSVLQLDLTQMSYEGAPVLGPLSLRISTGETVALVGPSGIGKTTVLRIMAGLETGFDGTLHAASPVGLIFQEPTLLPWRTVFENLQVTTGITREEAETWLSQVGLAGRGEDFPGQLSLGQQRRLSIARAFAIRPAVLLMDEPFVSLDPELVEDMMRLFAELRDARGVATVLVTHVEAEADKLADRILTLGRSPATITAARQNSGAYFQSSASGVTSSRS